MALWMGLFVAAREVLPLHNARGLAIELQGEFLPLQSAWGSANEQQGELLPLQSAWGPAKELQGELLPLQSARGRANELHGEFLPLQFRTARRICCNGVSRPLQCERRTGPPTLLLSALHEIEKCADIATDLLWGHVRSECVGSNFIDSLNRGCAFHRQHFHLSAHHRFNLASGHA